MRWLIVVIAALGLGACTTDGNKALGTERDRAPGVDAQGNPSQAQPDSADQGDFGRMVPRYDSMPDPTRQGSDQYGMGVDQGANTAQPGMVDEQRGGAAPPGLTGQERQTQPGGSIPEAGIEGVTPQSGDKLDNQGTQRGRGSDLQNQQHGIGSDRHVPGGQSGSSQPDSIR